MAERTLPGLGLTAFWDLGANTWKPGMDANLRLLSVIVRGWAKSRATALPGTPVLGDVYLVPSDAAQQANNIAIWDGAAGAEDWVYAAPQLGLRFYVEDEAKNYQWNGTNWAEIATGGNGGSSTLAGLSDVAGAVAATVGQALVKTAPGQFGFQDVAAAAASGGANWSVPHRGVTVTMNSQTLDLSGGTILSWDNLVGEDPDGFWDGAAPTQFKIPAGIKKIRLHAHLDIDGTAIASNTSLFMTTRKNGLTEFPGTGRVGCEVGFTNHAQSLHSGVIDVEEDNLLTVSAQFGSDSTVAVLAAGSYFQLEVVEVDDAQDRDRDVAVFVPGTPSASALVYQDVLARAMTLKSGATKSQAVSRIAATAEAVFSITRNDVAVGSVTFAAAASVGTFTVAADAAFAAGDRIGIVAPSVQDATLADISLTLVLAHS